MKHSAFSHHPMVSVAKPIKRHLSNQHIVFPALMCVHVVYDTLVNSKRINYVIINHIPMIYFMPNKIKNDAMSVGERTHTMRDGL